MIASASILLAALVLLPGQADPEMAVDAGREALDGWWADYPWYDASNDDLRPIDVSEPWYVRLLGDWDSSAGNWNWRLGSWIPSNLGEWFAWGLLLVCFGALAYLMYRVLRARTRGQAAGVEASTAETAEEHQRRVEALPWPARRRPTDLLAEARRHYEAGNFGEAVIYLFSHQLVELDRHRMIRLDKGKTNRQYVRELASQGRLRSLLEQTMYVFEDVFFGNRALERRRFESCWSKLDEFNGLLAAGSGETSA